MEKKLKAPLLLMKVEMMLLRLPHWARKIAHRIIETARKIMYLYSKTAV